MVRSIHLPLRELPALQQPGYDPLIRKWVAFEGLSDRLDVRLYLGIEALERLLEAARSSLVRRVAIHGLQFELEERQARDGHRYVVCAFTGVPVPDESSASATLAARRG